MIFQIMIRRQREVMSEDRGKDRLKLMTKGDRKAKEMECRRERGKEGRVKEEEDERGKG